MKICEILSVGTELLLGNIVDTNQAFLSRELARMGVAVYFRQTCGDNRARLEETVRLALSRSDLVIITGGLGPTYDDVTKSVVAHVLEMPLREDPAVVKKLEAFFAGLGRTMTPNNLSQALVPEGGEILENDWGTAPGLWLEKGGKTVVLMPGVPREMKPMFLERVAPRLLAGEPLAFFSVTLHLYGIGESEADQILKERFFERRNPTVAPYAKEGEVELRITASAPTAGKAEVLCRQTEKELFEVVGEFVYTDRDQSLAATLTQRLAEKKLSLAVEESGSAARLSSALLETPLGAETVVCSKILPRAQAPVGEAAKRHPGTGPSGALGLALFADCDPESPDYGSVAVGVYESASQPAPSAVYTRRFQRGKKEAAFLRTLAALFAEASLMRHLGLFREKSPENA